MAPQDQVSGIDEKVIVMARERRRALNDAIAGRDHTAIRALLTIDDEARPFVLGRVEGFPAPFLKYAIHLGDTAIASTLLGCGFNIERTAKQSLGPTPLFEAVSMRNLPMARLLISRGASLVVRKERSRQTVFAHAVTTVNPPMLELLLQAASEQGLDLRTIDCGHWSLLDHAVVKDSVELFDMLWLHGLRVGTVGVCREERSDPLDYAVNFNASPRLVAALAGRIPAPLQEGELSALLAKCTNNMYRDQIRARQTELLVASQLVADGPARRSEYRPSISLAL